MPEHYEYDMVQRGQQTLMPVTPKVEHASLIVKPAALFGKGTHLLHNHACGMKDAPVLTAARFASLHRESSSDHVQRVGGRHAYDAGTSSRA